MEFTGRWFLLKIQNDDGSMIEHQAFYRNEQKLLTTLRKSKIKVLSCEETIIDTRKWLH